MAPPKEPYQTSIFTAGPRKEGAGISTTNNSRDGSGAFNPATKRKAGVYETPRETAAERVLRELKTSQRDMNTAVGTGDYPQNALIARSINNKKDTIVLMSPNGPSRIPEDVAKFCHDLQCKFYLDSDSPNLLISRNNWTITIRGGTNMKFLPANAQDTLFIREEVDGKALLDVLGLAKTFESVLDQAELSDQALQALTAFGSHSDPKVAGLTCLTFHGKNNIYARWTGEHGKNKVDPVVKDFIDFFNKHKPVVTVVRKLQAINPHLDSFWMHRCRVVADKGLCPFFSEHVDAALGHKFAKWMARPEKLLVHQPWMQKPSAPDDEFKNYFSHAQRTMFGDMCEFEIVMSATLINEAAHERAVVEKYYAYGISHEAEVIFRRGSYVKMAVSRRPNKKVVPPTLADGATFKMRFPEATSVVEVVEEPVRRNRPAKEPVSGPKTFANLEAFIKPKEGRQRSKKDEKKLKAGNADSEKAARNNGVERTAAGVDATMGESSAQDPEEDYSVSEMEKQEASVVAPEEEVAAASETGPTPDADVDMPESRDNITPDVAADKEENPVAVAMDIDGKEPFRPVKNPRPTNGEWTAKKQALDTNRHFVIGFSINKGEHYLFPVGTVRQVELQLKINYLPMKRMLQGIADLAAAPDTDPNAEYMKAFLRGEPLPYNEKALSPWDQKHDTLSQGTQQLLKDYVAHKQYNKAQKNAWNCIIRTSKQVILIQGPPGTGKTALNVGISNTFGLLGFKAGLMAPTNKAVEALMKTMVKDVTWLYERDPSLKDTYKVIYLPTSVLFKHELQAKESELELYAFQSADENEDVALDLKPFLLWTHILALMEKRAKDQDILPAESTKAQNWIDTMRALRAGNRVNRKTIDAYIEIGEFAATKIISDPAVKVIVSTCNNAAQLRSLGFKCETLQIDESAFSPEQDSAVPRALLPGKLIETGDHQQLKPGSKGPHEYSNQYGLSGFERALANDDIPLFRLNINYRMHPAIADLPSLFYGWLGCDESTLKGTEAYAFMNELYHSPEFAQWRLKRRKPAYKDEAEEDKNPKQTKQQAKRKDEKPLSQPPKGMRRVFFNVQGSLSGQPEGSTSHVNYANALSIAEVCANLQRFAPKVRKDGKRPKIVKHDIAIITGYKEQKLLIEGLLKWIWQSNGWEPETVPEVFTIDSFQGGERDIIFLSVHAANKWHGSRLGFLGEWNRMNVALTRAKQVVWIWGNIDCWRSELSLIAEDFKAKKFAYFMIDLLDRGDIIDVKGFNYLPATYEEVSLEPQQWTRQVPQSDEKDSKFSDKQTKKAARYKHDAKLRRELELKLLKALNVMRQKAAEMDSRFKSGEDVTTNLYHNIEDDDQDPADEDEAKEQAAEEVDEFDQLTRMEADGTISNKKAKKLRRMRTDRATADTTANELADKTMANVNLHDNDQTMGNGSQMDLNTPATIGKMGRVNPGPAYIPSNRQPPAPAPSSGIPALRDDYTPPPRNGGPSAPRPEVPLIQRPPVSYDVRKPEGKKKPDAKEEKHQAMNGSWRKPWGSFGGSG